MTDPTMIPDLRRAFVDFRADLDPAFRQKLKEIRRMQERMDGFRPLREEIAREQRRYEVMRGYADTL